MIDYFAITNFVERIAALKNAKRGVYATVEEEVCTAFKDVSIEQIRQNRDMILLDDHALSSSLGFLTKNTNLPKKTVFGSFTLFIKTLKKSLFWTSIQKTAPCNNLILTTSK